MPKQPRITACRELARSRMFRIEELEVSFANGSRRSFERLRGESPGSVLIVPLKDADTVLLVREYAAAAERYELGLPKGRIEPGEEPLGAANREIMEEIGFAAKRLRLLRTLTVAPGYIQHETLVVLAEDLYPQAARGDEPEALEVVPWRLSKLNDLLAQADCTDARTLAALYLTRSALLRE